MKLTAYKLKISIFVNFLVFLMIFLTGSFFLYFNFFSKKQFINTKLNKTKEKIIKLNKFELEDILNQLNELSLVNIVDNIVGNKDNPETNFLKEVFGTKYINIYDENIPIYIRFNEQACGKKLLCSKIKKYNLQFIVGVENIKIDFKKSLLNFALFSFFISLLFFPVIYWIVARLTKPIEENLEFMKNFVNNAGHELKTPLANINLSAQILLNQKQYNEEILKQIESESGKLSQLIDTLLQMSILSKFQNKDKLNLKKEIEDIILKYKDQIEKKGIKLNLKLENLEKNINKNHFEILFRNLFSNAIKYNIDNGQISIYLSKDKLMIENTGKEIPQKEKKKIFDLFYRLEKNNNGYGLGLALVKKICQINKWKIKLESKKGLNRFIVEF